MEDEYLHQSEKLAPGADPHQSQKLGVVEHYNGAMETPHGAVEANPGTVEAHHGDVEAHNGVVEAHNGALVGLYSVGQWLQMQNHLDEEPDQDSHQSEKSDFLSSVSGANTVLAALLRITLIGSVFSSIYCLPTVICTFT